jgi:hypothetical protein
MRVWDWCPKVTAPHGEWVTTNTRTTATGSSGVLAVLTDAQLRDELDRVAAAVGVRVVHAGGSPVSRKTWSAAAAVVLDAAAADRCGRAVLPRRAHVSVLTDAEPATATWAAAIAVGAQHVLRLPEQEHELIRELAEAAESARDDGLRGEVVAVIGGCGGAGASMLAVALAQAAPDALLVDIDPWGGGIDLLVGGETTPGVRWPDLALQGGRLNWSAVCDALPRHRGISLLSGTRRGYELDAGPVDAVIDAGRRRESPWSAIFLAVLPMPPKPRSMPPILSSQLARAMCGRVRRPRRWLRYWPRPTPTSGWSCADPRRAD